MGQIFSIKSAISSGILFNTSLKNLQKAILPVTNTVRWCSQEVSDSVEGEGEEGDTASKKRIQVSPEVSMQYLNSEAYKNCYQDEPVWFRYRRNHKGGRPRFRTRKTCIRGGELSTGNPCPICRDEYLVPHPKNVKLLEQFISPNSGQILCFSETGVCQKQHRNLMIAIEQAWDYGYIDMPLPDKNFDYEEYYSHLRHQKTTS